MRSVARAVVTVRRTGQFSIYFSAAVLFPLTMHAVDALTLIPFFFYLSLFPNKAQNTFSKCRFTDLISDIT
jgi:hypothetical protein